ncbi:MAG: hypothetical protein HOG73_05700 [Candidatus Marinimicrobia bacterium]|jgi:hypothetical protein|nr:hypothetical protein [Candidatus Neomarinimicrobiota bacterium]MBT5995192.1 hypothetical protein [Candidatus Neomarinimicrobiota bacterium]MBT6390800.1 hypothetical protein [Candidatus Neomarinimicrobiota bacterium]MDP6201360.1 hypothetical protein [Candidatus Neomarinimicrobiota bacterium]|tara:strand:- start:1024 stop:1659 length:636 start_codon:yes stop_codon:yes gene_type:complete
MVYSTIKPILISLILFSGFSLGQEKPKKNLNPVLQSALLPGWGQKSLNYSDRSRVFTYVESGLVLSIIGSTTYANILKKNYIAYAVAHAAVSSSGKSHKYWVDIGNFSTIEDYNDEHLRNREMDDIYEVSPQWGWVWDSDSHRDFFEQKRILSDQMKQVASFGVGAMILNHMVSAIDALYLKRIGREKALSVLPWVPEESLGFGYTLTVHF